MPMKRDFYLIEGTHTTTGQAVKTFQQIVDNIGEDKPCFYTLATFQNAIQWGPCTFLNEQIANDIINNLWYYPEVPDMLQKAIKNELYIQLGNRNLTLDDFNLC